MNKTGLQTITQNTIATDLEGLSELLGCGKETARTIAQLAEARIQTGSKRTIYSLEKVREYCARHSC